MKKDKYFGISSRIARWKIDNWFENWLSYKADNSKIWRNIYVSFYYIFDNKYYKGGMPFINEWLDKYKSKWEGKFNRKSLIKDMIYCLHRYGISFMDYWIFDFISKSNSARDSFVSDKLRYYYCDILNDKSVMPLMTDKYSCYKKFSKFYKRDIIGVYSSKDFNSFCKFAENHETFMYKPLEEHSGKGIELISLKDYDIKSFFNEKLSHGSFVVEELIIQGNSIARMNASCINSLRVVTFKNNAVVHIIAVIWRIGSGHSIVDNAHAGGMYAAVDPENGVVITPARRFNMEEFIIHPDSGVIIPGFQLPEWNEAKEIIKQIALTCPKATLISWDLCYSNKGWMLIEANDNGAWDIIQSNKKEGLKPLLYSLMNQYFS